MDQGKENILPSTKGVDLMEIFPKILNVNNETFKITPSEYIKEMSLTTNERHKKLTRISNTIKPEKHNYPPQFRILPHTLMFQKFETMTTNRLILEIKNLGKGLLPLKMHCPNSIYFSATYFGTPVTKLAPGLSAEYEIIFTPKEERDYHHYLVFNSKEDTFQVPIVAIGPRPMLDVPDQIILNPSPVKIPTSKHIIVRNIGNARAVFNFIPQGPHFQVTPAKGVLGINDTMLLNVTFESATVKEVTESLHLSLESGEKIHITLHGSAENNSIRLDKNSVVHEDTYIGLKRYKTVRLVNSSSHVVKFCWKKNKTEKEDRDIVESMKKKFKELSELEKLKDAKVIYYGLSNAEKHKISCERILQDELRLSEKEEFKFVDEVFSIMPECGEVWPKSSVEMMISFKPKVCGLASAEAYLEVSGRDSRLPLRIKGTGQGPNIILSAKTLDIDYIFLCSLHTYEITVENIGDIPGTIEYVIEPLVFGGKVEIIPHSRYLKAGELGAFVISLTSNRPGEFTEKIFFNIKESGEKVCLIFKGNIVSPMLNFDAKQILFGVVPLGVSVKREVHLHNLSMVPVEFSLRVYPDGEFPSISCEAFSKFTIKPVMPQNPKEFEVDPEESVVEPFSTKKVTVILTANKVGRYEKELMVDLWDSESRCKSCLIKYTAHLPSFSVVPEELIIPFCFINYPYTKTIVLKNNSSVSGFFYIVPRDSNADVPMTFSASISQGLLEPGAKVQIEMIMITSALGRQVFPIRILTFGMEKPEDICSVSCVGQGPVVTVRPLSLNWGEVTLLQSVKKTLQFTNESPIPAQLSLSMMKGNFHWNVDPSEVKILPQKSVVVEVSLFLKDCGKFQDNLKVNIYNGKDSQVPLHATGVGSSLVLNPKISPNYSLGTLFSQKNYQFEISIENKGNRSYNLLWSKNPDYKAYLNEKLSSARDQTFTIQPVKVDLMSGETKSILLEVFSKNVGYMSRMFYGFINLGGSAKELHMTTEISADFVEPMISCDKSEIVLWTNNGVDNSDVKLEDTISLQNTSMLPLYIEISTSNPFCLEKEPGQCVFSLSCGLDGLESRELTVKFLTPQSQGKFSKTFNGRLEITFQGHSKKIIIPIIGRLSYPNVAINPKNVDLGYQQVGIDTYTSIKLVNMSPLIVHYSIKWITSSSYVVPFERAASVKSLAPGLSEESEIRSESGQGEASLEVIQKLEAESLTSENPGDPPQSLIPPIKPIPRMPEIQVSSSDIKATLFPIARDYYTCDTELVDAYLMAPTYYTIDPVATTNLNDFCDITPFYGTLDPHCSQILTVSFSSKFPVQLHAQALLQVESGPEEIITINATSSEVDFQLSSTELDFGKQLFCETKRQILRIQNIASMPFPFEAETEDKCECEMDVNFPLGRGVMTVSPSTGTVNSFETAEVVVRYHPGVPGKFENNFQLQIAHLDPITIKVKGIGVFPQVYLTLPRPEILKIPPEVGYSAVASITSDWILTSSLSGLSNPNPLKPYRSQESNFDILEDDTNEEKWELIKRTEFMPSEIDIYLAVERILAYNLIMNDKNNVIFAVYARTIPGFTVPAYHLDFGVCAIGYAVEQNVTIKNFGPLPVVIYGIFDSHLKERGIYIRLKNRNEIKLGASLSFVITFNPKKSKYKKKYHKLEFPFYFEIYHGPKIPMKILAEVTYPHVLPSMLSLNFYEVVCGCCRVINLRLKNPGLVPAQWFMSIKTKEEMYQQDNSGKGKSMFYLDNYSGSLEPEEYGTVQVFFKPNRGDSFSAVLHIQVFKGLENLKILLLGSGVEPKLSISKKVLDFRSTLPFPNKTEKIFTLCNSCPFPIEFYFLEFDDQIFEEEKILRALILYYDANELLLPVRQPGDGLPIEIIDFYNMLLEALNAKFIEDERYKLLEEREKEHSEENAEFGEDQLNPFQVSFSDKKKKKMKKLSRSRTSMETTREAFGSSMSLAVAPIYEQKTPEEIQNMLEDYIRYTLSKELAYDPVQTVLNTLLPPEEEEEYRDGTLIICHGAPYTNSFLLANKLSIFTNMSALSIDNIVLTEAAFGRCEAGLTAKDLIEQAYCEYIEPQQFTAYYEWGENEGPASEDEGFNFESNFDEIEGKFNALLQLRESLLSGKRKNGRPETGKSDISKLDKGQTASAKPQMNLNAPIANISEELVVEILRFRLALEVEEGVIIERLESTFMSSTTNALISLLKAAGNVKDIIVVFFLNNYDQYHQNQLNIQAEQELAKLYLREEILKIIEEEPEEVFESLNLNPEDANMFREIFLMKRHESHILFEKKKAAFYEVERLKRQALKNGLPVPLRSFTFEETASGDKKEKDNGKKKEVGKGTKNSDTTSRRTESGTNSAKIKRDTVENDFLDFELEFTEMKTIIENWDQRLGALVLDSTTEVKTKKGQTPRKVDSASINRPKIDRGVFLWLVDVSRPYTNSILSCCCQLKATLEERQTASESDSWPLTINDMMTFSVVSMPPKRSRNPLGDVFTISATENVVLTGEDQYDDIEEYSQTSIKYNLNRSMSSLSMKSKKKDSRASRRRKTDSRMSAEVKSLRSKKTFLGSGEFQVKPRWILMPGERQSFKVKYYPVEVGLWTQDYSINIVACCKEEIIHCQGICDFPRVDTTPSVMFPLVHHNKPLNNIFPAAYYHSEGCYDFSSLIISDLNEKKKSQVLKVVLNLVNISTLPVDLCFVFGESGTTFDVSTSENFTVEPNKLWIAPEEKKEVVVAVSLAKIGPVFETLLFLIKDNPKVERINLACEGVKPNVVVSPQILQFDRLLLHRKDFRRVVLSNDNKTPLYFSLKNPDKFPSQIYFTHVSGCIVALGAFTFQVHYNATEAQLISGIPVEIEVFDSEDFQDPVQVLELIISAEAYDAALDITFSNIGDDHIDFGDIRVGNQYAMEFYLKNVGKYQLAYKFDVDTAFLSESGNEEFYLIPQDAKLPPGKLFPVKVIFMAHTEVSWKRETLFKLGLVEPFSADELIAAIPIEVSARSHFSKYEIKPPDHLNFGHIPIGKMTKNSLMIENKGHFSLTYWIEFQSVSISPEERENIETKKSSKMSTASKEKGKKSSSCFRAGIFEIFPNSGTAEPGQAAVVTVTCCPVEVKTFEEDLVVFVSESFPNLKKGVQITISAEGCLPKIRFDDYKILFREHIVSKHESDLSCRNKMSTYTIYTENNNQFSFKNVCVGKTAKARIYLQNAGLIDCKVNAFVGHLAEEERKSANTSIGGSEYFTLSPEKLIIEPYNAGSLLLTFKPDALEVYKAKLTIVLEMPDTYEDEVRVFDLYGNGILPQIEITEPSTKLPDGQALVNFPPTSPGHTSCSSIAFTNTGILDCKVIIEVCNQIQTGVFTLSPKESTEKMLKIWELTKPIDLTTIVSLSPGQTAEFDVMFNPQAVQSYSSQIKLFIVDNPFENWCYKLAGEVFFEEVVVEKIRTTMPFLKDENRDKSSPAVGPGQYYINFADCYVKKKSKAMFRLSNKTEKDYFKFEWEEPQSISVSPAIGHLYPNSYKEILLEFHPEEPMELEYATLSCTLNKILFGIPPKTSWDSRLIQYQKQFKGDSSVRSNDKNSSNQISETIMVSGEEPEHEVIPESSRPLNINLSGIADYTRLTCETTKITFKNTFMFQTRMYALALENTGNVALEYKLGLKSVTVWPLKEDKNSQVDDHQLMKFYRTNSRPQSSNPINRSGGVPMKNSRCGRRPRPLSSVVDFHRLTSNSEEQSYVLPLEETKATYFNPFSIENAMGRIQSKEKAFCNIVFSPMDINEYKTTITIQVANLHPECSLPEIEVTASSIMPYCHFDVPESDYLESGRRECTRPGPIGFSPGVPLHPDTKTIEVKVLGVGTTTPIKFHGINPTEDDYTFSWVNITQSKPDTVPSFHCSTVDGLIRAGRQQLMVFNFISQKVGITESFWKFSIPKYGVETPFLFVGDVREPAVCFLSTHVNLMPTLIGSSSSGVVALANHEEKLFEFYFIPESLYSEGRLNALVVEPLSGKIPPNSEISIRVTFTGKTAGKTQFSLKCRIKSVKEPFVITVEATTYMVQPVVTFEDLQNVKHYPEINKKNIIDFGSELNPHIPETITITLTSLSKTSFYYYWEYNERVLEVSHCSLKFSVRNGHVTSFSRGKCDLTIVFQKKSSLVNFPVQLKIRRGPTFDFFITGSASTLLCEFSFNRFDFGYCFLQEKDICFNETSLYVTNKSTAELFLECVLADSSAFSCSLPDPVIHPLQVIEIPICFHPKDFILYEGTLKFILNGTHERLVQLSGHGAEFKVILAEAEDTTISLGAVKIGKTSVRKFALANKSLATATLLLGFSDQLPVNGSYLLQNRTGISTTQPQSSEDHRLTDIITIVPSTVFRMKPQETIVVSVTYTPQKRSPLFSEMVYLQCQEKAEPLCMLTGCCLGPEISLDRYFLNFGAVVECCTRDLKLKLVNSGSIGARFEWNTTALTEYSVFPASGYCSPESDVTITVTFSPSAIQNCIRRKVECKLYLSENESYPSLWLGLMGDCISLPEPEEVVDFECYVRETVTKEIDIQNPSGNDWHLIPIISGEYFRGFEILVVPALSSATYHLEYYPLAMAGKGNPHTGSVFFKLPSGQGLQYQMRGVSLPPNAEEKIERDVPCKTKYVELLKIKNWLQCPQRFKAIISPVEQGSDDPTATCAGSEYLEIPATAQKEYSLNFFAYNIGNKRYNVKFINEESGEYVWFDVGFNVLMCGPLEVITLKSGVRQSCQAEVKLENPLQSEVRFQLETTSPEVDIETPICEVPPQETVNARISFTPIHPGDKTEMLTVSCAELGVFPRELRLISMDVLPEPTTTFETPLGTSQTQEFSIKNFSRGTAIWRFKVDSGDFEVTDQGTVPAGETTNIEVTYEPSEIGSTTATFVAESEQAGNFVFPLMGMCVKPLVKGPFTLKPGSGVTIPFKNVFKKPREFYMYVDNQVFFLKNTQETLSPKEECKIFVGFQKVKYLERISEYKSTEIQPQYPMMGQLVVECFNPYVKWQFYLKGVLDK